MVRLFSVGLIMFQWMIWVGFIFKTNQTGCSGHLFCVLDPGPDSGGDSPARIPPSMKISRAIALSLPCVSLLAAAVNIHADEATPAPPAGITSLTLNLDKP